MPDEPSDDEKNATITLTQPGEQKHHVRVGLPGGTVHELEVDGNAQLSTVVSRIRDIEKLSPLTKRVRLIVAGKLFSDHSQIIKDVVDDGGFIHCAISDFNRHTTPGATTAATDFLTTSSSSPIINDPHSHHVRGGQVHIPIDIDVDVNGSNSATAAAAAGTTNNRHHHHHHDPNDSINVNADGEVRIVIPNLNSQTAFDRLLRAGFTPDEIRMIRRHVRALRREARGARASATLTAATTAATTVATETYDPTNEVDVQNSPSPSSNNNTGNNERNGESRGVAPGAGDGGGGGLVHAETTTFVGSGGEGTNGDFLMGCIFGYLLGIIILVLLLDNHATRRWRVGIIAGVATNCAFGVLRSNLYLHASTFPAH